MTPQTLVQQPAPQRLHEGPTSPPEGGRAYAISFDMDIESLKLHWGDPYSNAYAEMRKVL